MMKPMLDTVEGNTGNKYSPEFSGLCDPYGIRNILIILQKISFEGNTWFLLKKQFSVSPLGFIAVAPNKVKISHDY